MTDYLWAAKANGWDVPTTRTVLRYYIDDPALQVYDDMVRHRASEGVDVEDIPIEAVYEVLEAQYMSTQAKNKAHNNLFRLRKKPDESVSDFLTRFRQVSPRMTRSSPILSSVPRRCTLSTTASRIFEKPLTPRCESKKPTTLRGTSRTSDILAPNRS